MINFGTQYYRPPFPIRSHWKSDLARMKEAGLNCVQLWVLWAWVESKPGKFDFSDYDELVDIASKCGLKVVLSLIAEVQPLWIPREVPGSELVNHLGQKVISESRNECHFGLTPGGCFDHPEVWRRMSAFIRETVKRYKSRRNIAGWDVWNELRWSVQADGYVCHCKHTMNRFRAWLSKRHGGLDGLNKHWIRRYCHWEDVRPGKTPSRPYTEMMAFLHFLTWRSNMHAIDRYNIVKGLDPARPATVHGPSPCHTSIGHGHEQALSRGNDWLYADSLDGIGCSNFPAWWGMHGTDYSVLMESVSSAARGKRFWVSELQGGRSNIGFSLHPPVKPEQQQRWIWNAAACKADTILLWCWRDEVFGGESSGFGVIGDDGYAEGRIELLKKTGRIFAKHEGLLESWTPDAPQAGVFFSPQTYYLHWSQDGSAEKPLRALRGWAKAFVETSMPFKLVEEEHLEELKGLKLLILPKVSALDDEKADRLLDFVKAGGTILCECGTGAWDSRGIFRYPGERFIAEATGLEERGKRPVPKQGLKLRLGKRTFSLGADQWVAPWTPLKKFSKTLCGHPDGALALHVPYGKGKIVLCGAFLGEAYDRERNPDFEGFLRALANFAGVPQPPFEIKTKRGAQFGSGAFVKCGRAGRRRMAFVFFPPDSDKLEIVFRKGYWKGRRLQDMLSGGRMQMEQAGGGALRLKLKAGPWRMAVLFE